MFPIWRTSKKVELSSLPKTAPNSTESGEFSPRLGDSEFFDLFIGRLIHIEERHLLFSGLVVLGPAGFYDGVVLTDRTLHPQLKGEADADFPAPCMTASTWRERISRPHHRSDDRALKKTNHRRSRA